MFTESLQTPDDDFQELYLEAADDHAASENPKRAAEAPPTDFQDEAELVDALRAGDAQAFAWLERENGPRMLAVARRILPEDADARDAVQDAFVSAVRGIERFEGGSRVSTWLHRIVVNAALMKLRSRRRRPESPFEPEASWAATDALAGESLERRERRERVRDAIASLAPHHREIIRLRDLEERDTRETAGVLSISPSAVKTRLHRARRALRSRLEREGERDEWEVSAWRQSA